MEKIQLSKSEWQYDLSSPLGKKGGFGQVFSGSGNGIPNVAVKKLHVSANDAAHRELRIAEELSNLNLTHIVPVFDAGQDAGSNSYFVVMALADESLQDAIDAAGTFADAEAVAILSDIATGLREVSQFVHRDLKPLNVLRHEGRWKIADFGIARFVEESTAIDTLKDCLSPQYAAPEQWNLDRATSATDIYALGCIAYALINGYPPFDGPTYSDFKRQHTQEVPPAINTKNSRLATLVGMMLRKEPSSRPSVERVISMLNGIRADIKAPLDQQSGLVALARAGASAAEEALRREAIQASANSRKQQRESLKVSAVEALEREVIDPLFERIIDIANAKRTSRYVLELGQAKLEYHPPVHSMAIIEDGLPASKWDVIAMARIAVIQQTRPYIWGASLLYTDRGIGSGYRWYELQFMASPLSEARPQYEPFATDRLDTIDMAIQGILGGPQLAARPKPIDDEDFPAFEERWAELFAKACSGGITRPHTLPIESLR